MDRRRFLKTSTTAGAVAIATGQVAKAAASERVRVGCVGCGGRALSLVRSFAENENAEIVAMADIDPKRFPRALAEAKARQGSEPKIVKDFRHLVDDPTIDALVVGTPDHWHAIPTIMGCIAGKDVYVEKPDSHNIVEGQRMVAAMRKHKRIVQMGSQHRSTERLQSALEYLKSGVIGKVLVARAWESTRQGSIGFPKDATPPEGVDYDMWLGSAPKRPYNPNRFHGRWRWFHDYGTGDLGNDGVHRIDMAFAALNAARVGQGDKPLGLPDKITSSGGKWYFNDMQEFPDTLQVNYEYQPQDQTPAILTYEMRIWAPYTFETHGEGSAVYGDRGYVIIGNSGWRAYSAGNKLVKSSGGDSHERPHMANFIDCIKSRDKPYCDLETVGHPASVLCHAGNISARVGRQLHLDHETESFKGDEEANALRGRPEWRKPWTLPEV